MDSIDSLWFNDLLRWETNNNIELIISRKIDSEFIGLIKNIENILKTNFLTVDCKDYPEEFGYDPSYQYFTLENKFELTKDIKYFKSLEYLIIEFMGLTRIPSEISFLKNLKVLKLIDLPHLEYLPEDLWLLKNLEELHLGFLPHGYDSGSGLELCTRIKDLSSSIFNLENLQTLVLDGNPISYLPESMCKLKSLKKISANVCGLNQLPINFGLLKNLREVSLSDNDLESLPSSIVNIQNLKKINLLGNPNLILSDEQKEWILENRINGCNVSISDEILIKTEEGKIENWIHNLWLWADDCGIKDFDTFNANYEYDNFNFDDDNYSILYEVNPYIGIPRDTAKLIKLKELALIDPCLEFIPNSFTKLFNLEKLFIHCNLNELPDKIFNLINLKHLYLDHNKIENLPDNIHQLKNLEIFSLINNNLKYLPTNIVELQNLKYLNLSKNYELRLTQKQLEWIIGLKNNGCQVIGSWWCHETNSLMKSYQDEWTKVLIEWINSNGCYYDFFTDIGIKSSLPNLLMSKEIIISGEEAYGLSSITPKKNIPNELANISNLESLIIMIKGYDNFPSNIFNLVNLREFTLEDSDFMLLPENINNLVNLNKLFIINTKLMNLPKNIIKLDDLMELKILNNPNLTLSTKQIEWIDKLKDGICNVEIDLLEEENKSDYWIDDDFEKNNEFDDKKTFIKHNRYLYEYDCTLVDINNSPEFEISISDSENNLILFLNTSFDLPLKVLDDHYENVIYDLENYKKLLLDKNYSCLTIRNNGIVEFHDKFSIFHKELLKSLSVSEKVLNSCLESKIIDLSNLLIDYRSDEALNPSRKRVEKWINQFSYKNREIILDELIFVFQKTYIQEYKIDNYLFSLIVNYDLVGNDPYYFWDNASLLDIQKDGQSQKILVEKLIKLIYTKYGINVSINNYNKCNFVYVDDFLFSGLKLRTDLITFMNQVPFNTKLSICYLGVCTSGEFYIKDRWLKTNNSKRLQINIFKMMEIENRNSCQNISDVLYPTSCIIENNKEIKEYLSKQVKINIRDENQLSSRYCKNNKIFSSEENRKILEEEFTLAGLKIINSFNDETKKRYWKPLGVSTLNGLGFGGMIVTHRNCPNNVPLAIWWGDTNATNSSWIPLLPRKTYMRD